MTQSSPNPGAERFRLLVEAVGDYGIFMLNPQGFIQTWNLGARRLNGYEDHEAIGKHFSVFYPPEDIAAGKPENELRVATAEGRFKEEGWRLRKDGSRFWANVVMTRVDGPGGDLVGFAKVTRDVSERRQMDLLLRESEERYRLLVEAVRDYAIFMLDPTGHVATWNLGARRLKGYTPEEIIGQHFSRFYPAEDIRAGRCEYELREAMLKGRFEDEGWRLRKDGTCFWASVVLTALRDERGVLRGFTKVTRDMTERKRAEDKLRMAYEGLENRVQERTQELAQANAILQQREGELKNAISIREEFLTVASHELKTPVTALKLQWQMILRKLSARTGDLLPIEKLHKAVEVSVRQLNRLTVLIEDLLDVSRVQSGQLELRLTTVSLSTLVQDVVDRMAEELEASECTVTINVKQEVMACIDALRMEQVVVNLLSNATKYAAHSPVNITISEHEGIARISVHDQGLGVAQSQHARIFERFERAVPSTHISGMGLGLYIARCTVEAHRGRIWVESEPREGATFFVEFPLRLPVG